MTYLEIDSYMNNRSKVVNFMTIEAKMSCALLDIHLLENILLCI
jgi:hypothetical protein